MAILGNPKPGKTMRFALPLIAVLLSIPATAQSDAQQKALESLQQNGAYVSSGVSDVKVEDDNDPFTPNEFVGSFRMEVHSFVKGVEAKESPTNMRYWSSPDMTLIGISPEGSKGAQIKMLTDLKGKWSYMLMTDEKGNKTGMKSRKKKITFNTSESDSGKDNGKFTVTTETKVIEGHTCTKVVGTTEEGTWTGWVAKDIVVPFGDIANSMSRSAIQKKKQNWEGLQGFPLEYEIVDKNGKDKLVVYVKDLQIGSVDPSVFSISGYKMMEIPGMPGQ